jgi:hypothetical protein
MNVGALEGRMLKEEKPKEVLERARENIRPALLVHGDLTQTCAVINRRMQPELRYGLQV